MSYWLKHKKSCEDIHKSHFSRGSHVEEQGSKSALYLRVLLFLFIDKLSLKSQ